MTSPAPVYVSRAIADALADDARAADRYLREHAAMLEAGVPVEHVRAVLDHDLLETDCTRAVISWNDRGTLCLCGSLGIGKTIAAAQWLLEAVRRGVSCMWLNAVDWSETKIDDQPALVARAKRVRALVIDDIGAGTTGPRGHRKVTGTEERDWYFQQIEGVLMKRAALPTIALANFNASTMETWMGPRLMDRESMYGAVVFIQGKSLRERDRREYDGAGLGPKHAAARELVDSLGVKPASSWDHERGEEVWRVDVGHVLEQRTRSAHAFARSRVAFELGNADDACKLEIEAKSRRQGLRACSDVAKANGLDGERIKLAALELEANDPAELLLSKAIETLNQDTPVSRSKRRFQASIADDNAARSRVTQETLEAMTTRLRGEADPGTVLEDREPAAWTGGAAGLAKMKAMGYRVAPLGGGRRGYEVRQGSGHGMMIMPAHDSVELAWHALRLLLTPPIPPLTAEEAAQANRAAL